MPTLAVVERLNDRVVGTEMDVMTRSDGSLRRLSAIVQFDADAVDDLASVFGAYAGVRVAVGLRFSPALDVTATRATR